MKERPILFSSEMVRAILDGRKTQTRRIAKGVVAVHAVTGEALRELDSAGPRVVCPYGTSGDRLWVRETAACGYRSEQPPHEIGRIGVDYKAGGSFERKYTLDRRDDYPWFPSRSHNVDGLIRWAPAIHMPRWASRITLEVTGVRVELLQDISEADAQAEGCSLECMTPTGDDSGSAIYGPGGYRALWESINGSDSWAANPWVWVVEFRRIEA